MTDPSPDTSLDAIRREIDVIDDQILDLLGRRFAATGKVKATKSSDGSIASSPLRPAREAAMLRRLVGKRGAAVSPETLVRLWRVILSASTQSQAPITLHVDGVVAGDLGTRLIISQHFCDMPVEVHMAPARALETLRDRRGDLAVVATGSDWASSLSSDEPGAARVIGTLPVFSGDRLPGLLVMGFAEPQESGDDETLIISSGRGPQFCSALWQANSGSFTLTSLPGFLLDEDPVLCELLSRLPGAFVAGRYPRPIKVP